MNGEIISLVLSKLKTTSDSVKKIPDYNDLKYISYLNADTGNEETFLVYDCSGNNHLDIDILHNCEDYIYNEYEDDLFNYLFIFDNLDEEEKQKRMIISKLKYAAEKKRVNEIFQMKKAIYRQGGRVTFLVDDGINYIEYRHEASENGLVRGYIYNVSYFELKKLFNVTGRELFRANIREGMVPNARLRSEFTKYLLNGLYSRVNKKEKNEFDSIMYEYFCENKDVISAKDSIPEMFWFKHNGVTIYVSGDTMNRTGNKIEFESANANVLNGAQTMTNLYGLVNEIKEELVTELNDRIENKNIYDAEEYISNLLDEVCGNIIIKTIFINSDGDYIRGISNGLNTQVPITDLELIASEDEVAELNKKFNGRVRIIKPGEYSDKNNMNVLNFAKKYQIIKEKPGTSKNLNKNKVKEVLEEAAKEDTEDILRNIIITIDADEWWGKNVKEIKSGIDVGKENIVKKYGRNYYGSYVINSNQKLLDSEDFEQLYIDFTYDIDRLNKSIEMKDFKKDELYNEVIMQKEKRIPAESITKEVCDNIVDYLNECNVKKNASIYISKFLNSKGISLEKYKTISATEDGNYIVISESMPFPSGTFFEINNTKDYDIKFEDSLFKKEIEKEVFLFVLIKDKENEKYKKAIFLKDFSLKKYVDKARMVFESTVKCFKEGDESKFVKISDNQAFHVRPKAANSDDTFQFSNGKEIVKSTFWANRNIVEELINDSKECREYLNESSLS